MCSLQDTGFLAMTAYPGQLTPDDFCPFFAPLCTTVARFTSVRVHPRSLSSYPPPVHFAEHANARAEPYREEAAEKNRLVGPSRPPTVLDDALTEVLDWRGAVRGQINVAWPTVWITSRPAIYRVAIHQGEPSANWRTDLFDPFLPRSKAERASPTRSGGR